MSRHLKPYDSYKDSGVEWLGQVPEHWEVKRLKFVAELELSNVDKKTVDGEQEVKLCNYTDVYYNDRIDGKLCFMRATASSDQIERLSLTNGDVVITKDSEDPHDIGVPTYVNANVRGLVCGYHLAILRSRATTFGLFLFHFFASDPAREWFAQEARGLTRFGLGKYSIENTELPVPPLPEQKAIAAYLDAETSRIDTLISEQQELIELLKEKRQALISHCVTKGLNPDIPMKDSGIEWLGEVPEHWAVTPLKHLVADLSFGVSVNATDTPAGPNEIGVLKTSCVFGDVFRPSENKKVWDADLDRVKCCVMEEALIITRMNTPDLVGSVGYVPKTYSRLFLPDRMWQIQLIREAAISKFYWRLLSSRPVKKEYSILATGTSSSMRNLTQESVLRMPVPLPPLPEQKQISDYLDRETARIDALITEAEETIDLMKEHRSALISAAVTGKVKVPGVDEAMRQTEAAEAG